MRHPVSGEINGREPTHRTVCVSHSRERVGARESREAHLSVLYARTRKHLDARLPSVAAAISYLGLEMDRPRRANRAASRRPAVSLAGDSSRGENGNTDGNEAIMPTRID
jgi:hypothetical protein